MRSELIQNKSPNNLINMLHRLERLGYRDLKFIFVATLNVGNDPMKDPMSVWLKGMVAPHGWACMVEDKALV